MSKAEAIGASVWGFMFVVVGVWWLLHELGFVGFDWSFMGPIAIIAVGLSMVVGWCCGTGRCKSAASSRGASEEAA